MWFIRKCFFLKQLPSCYCVFVFVCTIILNVTFFFENNSPSCYCVLIVCIICIIRLTIEIVLTIQSIICFIYTINYLITNLQNHTNLSWYKLDEELVLTIESITSFIYTINYLISNLLNYTNLSWCKLDEGFWLSNLLWTKQIISWFWSWRIMVVVRKMSGLVK